MLLRLCILLGAVIDFAAQQNTSLPLQLSPLSSVSTCSSTAAIRQANTAQVRTLLRDTAIPILQSRPPCTCGGPGEWTRLAYLNMSDPSHVCPTNWRLITTPVRGCGTHQPGYGWATVSYPSNGLSYSHVCGRINAYQRGSPSAFETFVRPISGAPIPTVESVYAEGVSLTHGAQGSRQHIWTFAAGLAETGQDVTNAPYWICACTNTNINWPYTVPSFVGNNYFCDSGNPGPMTSVSEIYSNNPMWDGTGCAATSTCCALNNPPWFCTTLPQPTTDSLEVRLCFDEGFNNEDALISLIDIYVK